MAMKRFVFTFLLLMCAGVAAPATQGFNNSPVRFWSFSKYVVGSADPILVSGGAQQGGKLDETEDFGPVAFNLDFMRDDFATENVFSSGSGKKFSVAGEAPIGNIEIPGKAIGSDVVLDQYQSYEKRKEDATLKITVSRALLETVDANSNLLSEELCPYTQVVCPLVEVSLKFEARVYSLGAGGDFFHTKGHALIIGYRGHWQFFAGSSADVGKPMWDVQDFTFDDPDDLGMQTFAFITDDRGVTLNVDLSPVKLKELFAVEVRMEVETFDGRGGESGVLGIIRDPEKIVPAVETTGLKRRGAPPLPAPPPDPPQPASCDTPNPDAGTVQFSDPTYVIGEWSGPSPVVIVTRTGGSTGPASVTLTTSPGTAEAGVDYDEMNKTIVFADGDTSPRIVELPIIHDSLVEPAETFNMTLSSPQCATLGDQTTAEVTIIDDDTLMVPPQQFTIGGTVSGLEGTGLVLVNQGGDPISIDADGAFQFSAPVPAGASYNATVDTQPSNPNQVCTVTNGAGTVIDHDITDVLVECSTTQTSGLDPTFGSNGIVSTQFGELQSVILQPDGSIVSAGNDGVDFALTRHTSSGGLDTSFDGDGKVTTDFAGGGIAGDEAFGLALQGDGKIVVVGSADNTQTFKDFAVARYNSDGSLDTSFGTSGKVITDFGIDTDGDGVKESGDDVATAVAIQPDGKIVVAGHVSLPKGGGIGFNNDFAVARYNPDGSLDTTFGNDGIVTTNVASDSDLANDMMLQPDGRIIVVGETNQAEDFAIVRYNNDGSLDTTFDNTGIVVTDFGGTEGFFGVALQADGKIIAVGNTVSGVPNFDFAVVRYNADGSLDPSFGNGGLVATDVSGGLQFGADFAEDVTVQQDGKIVVIGRNTSNTIFDFAMVRYDPDGAIDPTFVGNGILKIDFHGKGDLGQDVVIQPDGKIVGAGYAVDGNHFDFQLIRILP